MKSNNKNFLKKVFDSAYKKCCDLELTFENSKNYNNSLQYTFYRTFQDICEIGTGLAVLEVGSFTGVVSVALKNYGHDVTASDIGFVIDDPSIKNLFDLEGIRRYSVDLSKAHFPCESNVYDLIVFNEVIEHLNFNPIPLLKEFYRILKPGGLVYCATPNLLSAKNVFRILCRKGYLNKPSDFIWNLEAGTGMSVGIHWREWTKYELIELFRISGFSCIWHKYGLVVPNQSKIARKMLVALMYKLFRGLMPNQVALFSKTR
jgi:SAM-dependent methyltransferase